MATIDVLIILAYFLVVLGAGVLFARTAAENLESYFLGSKRINWLFLAMSGAVSICKWARTS